ncbi:MAG: hypothetical protein JSR21_12875 [Proteobacteria bacterium]|nr:hypothetical protein [Pseudomonadota bacterium]
MTELRASAHLMTLETGVFCIFQPPGSPAPADDSGLPGIRLSLPPGRAGNPDAVAISTFRADGWMNGNDSAALVRVTDGPAQILVTIYQPFARTAEAGPRLQVLRLTADPGTAEHAAVAAMHGDGAAVPAASPAAPSVVLHQQRTGDVGGPFGEWLGERGSKLWIEGFAINPPDGIAPGDIEYQGVLGRGWNSPWVEGGHFCGSRGMALPLLGIRARLKGAAAKTHTLTYAATFVDGSAVGPVAAGEACEAESLAALEALQITLVPRTGGAAEAAPSGRQKPPSARVIAARAASRPAAAPRRAR